LKKNKITVLALLITLVIGSIGCTATRPRTPMNRNTQNRIGVRDPNKDIARRRNLNMMGDRRNDATDRDPNTTDNMIRRNTGIGPRTATDLTRRDRMDTNTLWHRGNVIAKKVNHLKEVKNTTVLLSGNTAIIGVEIDRNVQGQMTDDLKNKIIKAVKDADGSIRNVSVTANPDLFTRISNIEKDIRDGRPISGFAEEFQEILRRINPVR